MAEAEVAGPYYDGGQEWQTLSRQEAQMPSMCGLCCPREHCSLSKEEDHLENVQVLV